MVANGLGRREGHLARMAAEVFDIAVVGGGITGAGVALDAAARGLRVALIERADFAGGTSSRSSKLIHGGLRYLAQYQFRVTRESLAERKLLLGLAPHLVESLPFVIPVYGGRRQWLRLATGLRLYDLLAGRRNSRRHQRLSRAELRRLAPSLRTDNLAAAYVYTDCRTNDARLTLAVLAAAARHGAALANYAPATTMLREGGRIVGCVVEDQLGGSEIRVRARRVVVAGGVWLDRVLPPPDGEERLRPSKGVHLILPRDRLATDVALYVPTGMDNRLIFVIPWLDRVLVGTTDTPYQGDLARPRATRADVAYLLDALNFAFPGADLEERDVIAVQAGLRPLLRGRAGSTSRASRRDRVFEAPGGAIAIGGGKLTTYRRMARHAVDLVVRRLRKSGEVERRLASRTDEISLLGPAEGPPDQTSLAALASTVVARVPPAQARHLIGHYGAGALDVLALAEREGLGAALGADAPVVRAEVVYAARHEMARTIGDVLARRTRLALTERDQARHLAPAVADLLAAELGWDEAERLRQLAAYEAEAEEFTIADE